MMLPGSIAFLIARMTLTASPCSAIRGVYLAITDTVLAGANTVECSADGSGRHKLIQNPCLY
jgi:hypothetical protein